MASFHLCIISTQVIHTALMGAVMIFVEILTPEESVRLMVDEMHQAHPPTLPSLPISSLNSNIYNSPNTNATLQLAAQNGPVIVLNISARRSDPVIVQKAGDPLLLPLSDTHPTQISNIPSEFTQAVNSLRIGNGVEDRKSSRTRVNAILRSLWDDLVWPVVQKLKEIGVPEMSRIWWCPTSDLAMLPPHATGPHRRNKPNLTEMHISSYTHTLSALLRSTRKEVLTKGTSFPSACSQNLLAVAQPKTPGQAEIPSVQEELKRVQSAVPSHDTLLNENGTYDALLASLRTHRWIHLMCHGSANFREPFESCFRLYDESLTLLDIVQARLPDVEFAFVSACHSATGNRIRPDETINLAAALQFTGFRSVIGTTYAMADADGPDLAEEVYKHLFRDAVKR
ncbi:hypothetical protein FRC02_003050 [Tulasnella sp. 418]|nr:hypothetical protein FRC02_003050 [Tulasnella sp. 418]